MMDAFDVFDSFIEQNTPPSQSKREAVAAAKDDVFNSTSLSASPIDMDIESVIAEPDNSIVDDDVNETG